MHPWGFTGLDRVYIHPWGITGMGRVHMYTTIRTIHSNL